VRQQEIVTVPVNMLSIIRESMIRLTDLIKEKNAEIILPESFPDVMGYESWLEEVWANYISNAIKYGGVSPVVKIGVDVLPDNRIKFWIKDNGKGLSEEEITLLFHKFTRLDTLRAEGHGLGLSIVKRIIEKLNGDTGVESENIPGEGCTFYFTLPTIEN
jgi:signal transduction histidine kinase